MAELPILHPGSVAGSQAKEARPMFNTEKIIRLSTVLARTGLSRSTLYRKIAEGTFPAQVRISVHGAGWHESAVSRWIADPPGHRADNDNPAPPSPGETGRASGRERGCPNVW